MKSAQVWILSHFEILIAATEVRTAVAGDERALAPVEQGSFGPPICTEGSTGGNL